MYIVTGGAGFIGSCFVAKLNSLGIKDVVIVDELGLEQKWKNIRSLQFEDFVNKDDFLLLVSDRKLNKKIDAVVHLGACSSTTEKDADFLLDNNYSYSRALAEWALKSSVRFVYASSAATYGDGSQGYSDQHSGLAQLKSLNMYGYSKHLFDLWAHRKGVLDNIASLKFFNVYGPNEYHKEDQASVVWKAFNQIQSAGSVRLFKSNDPQYQDGGQLRDFIYVKDCCDFIWWCVEQKNINGVLNVGTGKARSFNDLAKSVFTALGRQENIEYFDMPAELSKQYQNFTEADMSKAKELGCPVEFHSLEDGVLDYVGGYLLKDPYYY